MFKFYCDQEIDLFWFLTVVETTEMIYSNLVVETETA